MATTQQWGWIDKNFQLKHFYCNRSRTTTSEKYEIEWLIIKRNLMELIRPDDPQYFEQSSYEDYDRHHYKVVGKNGESIVVEDYMSAQEIWWNRKVFLSHIEVLDKPKKESKGFK